jgi:chromosome segregation ATPase
MIFKSKTQKKDEKAYPDATEQVKIHKNSLAAVEDALLLWSNKRDQIKDLRSKFDGWLADLQTERTRILNGEINDFTAAVGAARRVAEIDAELVAAEGVNQTICDRLRDAENYVRSTQGSLRNAEMALAAAERNAGIPKAYPVRSSK